MALCGAILVVGIIYHNAPVMNQGKKIAGYVLLFLLVLAQSGSHNATAQDIDIESLISKQALSCSDIAFGATKTIPDLHRTNKVDTLQALLQFWEMQCGITEPMMRYAILWQIETNTFEETWLPGRLLDHLSDHREAIETEAYANYYFDFSAWEYHAIHPGFNDFTRQMAKNIKQYADLSELERFFVDFYSHDFKHAMYRLSDGKVAGTRLDSLYNERRQARRNMPSLHRGLYFGAWSPTGQLKTLGAQPQIGLMFDVTRNQLIYGIYMNLGFGNTTQNYMVYADGEPHQTNHFMQVNIGMMVGVDLLNNPDYSIFLSGGFGYDGIDPISMADRLAGIEKHIHSLNLNAGLIYHRRFEEHSVFSIITRYNIVNYKNIRGTELSGNVITFGMGYGIRAY